MHIVEAAISALASWTVGAIGRLGAAGVFILMALESANIPIPSEVIMPFAGFASSRGTLFFWTVVCAGALGNVAGSALSYFIGRSGGRDFVNRWGAYFFVTQRDLARGEAYMNKYGVHVAFWSRLLPVVRTFISLPAGILRTPFLPFILYTALGSFLWATLLAAIGWYLGAQWQVIEPVFRQISTALAAAVLLIIILYIWYHIKNGKHEARSTKSETKADV